MENVRSGPVFKSSSVLFLLICSDHKTRESEVTEYTSTNALGHHLPEDAAQRLYETRRKIRSSITSIPAERDGKQIREFPLNKDLVHGPDFQFRGISQGGQYLPAAQRYTGRFYDKLGPNPLETLAGSTHHVLILSGLYTRV